MKPHTLVLVPVLAAFLAAGGCGKSNDAKPAGGGGGPAIAAGQTWRLADGRELGTLGIDLRERIEVTYTLLPSGAPSAIVFAMLQPARGQKGAAEPVIAGKVGNEIRVLPLVVESKVAFPAQEWATAGVVGDSSTLYAVLDSADETPSPVINILRSTDAGQTWTLFAGIRKPHASARFADILVTSGGKVSLSVRMDQTQGEIKEGRYLFRTTDGGKTWTGPEFEPDDYREADPSIDSLENALKLPAEG